MALKDVLLPEFDHEMSVTRTLLERVPDDRGDWRPHARSMSVGELALHLANIPNWMVMALERHQYALTPPGAPPEAPRRFEGASRIVAAFDTAVAKARSALSQTADEAFREPWSLKDGGAVRMTLPRAAVVRSFVLSHMIHHRGQLSVYLRLLDVPVPAVYGRTADTQ